METHQAIAPLLNTHQRLPHTPKLVRATTGNVTWKMAPGLAFATMNGATSPYPSQTHIQACHQERPSWIMEEAIIHLSRVVSRDRMSTKSDRTYVLILKLSATQLQEDHQIAYEEKGETTYNAIKFQTPHVCFSSVTGKRSSFYQRRINSCAGSKGLRSE